MEVRELLGKTETLQLAGTQESRFTVVIKGLAVSPFP